MRNYVHNFIYNERKTMNKEFGEVLITAGAGDIDMLVEPIKNELKEI